MSDRDEPDTGTGRDEDREPDDLPSEDPVSLAVPLPFGTDVIEEADRSTRHCDPDLRIET